MIVLGIQGNHNETPEILMMNIFVQEVITLSKKESA
jgi:hypothetical protein